MCSFKGNEADYVLISVVRSSRPGFLTSLNRVNVMLTRCRAGLVIVTSSSFLQGSGSQTLLGKLAQYWENLRGAENAWIDWREVAEGKADLPGAPGPRRETHAAQVHIPRRVDKNTRQQVSPLMETFDVSKVFRQASVPVVPSPNGRTLIPGFRKNVMAPYYAQPKYKGQPAWQPAGTFDSIFPRLPEADVPQGCRNPMKNPATTVDGSPALQRNTDQETRGATSQPQSTAPPPHTMTRPEPNTLWNRSQPQCSSATTELPVVAPRVLRIVSESAGKSAAKPQRAAEKKRKGNVDRTLKSQLST